MTCGPSARMMGVDPKEPEGQGRRLTQRRARAALTRIVPADATVPANVGKRRRAPRAGRSARGGVGRGGRRPNLEVPARAPRPERAEPRLAPRRPMPGCLLAGNSGVPRGSRPILYGVLGVQERRTTDDRLDVSPPSGGVPRGSRTVGRTGEDRGFRVRLCLGQPERHGRSRRATANPLAAGAGSSARLTLDSWHDRFCPQALAGRARAARG